MPSPSSETLVSVVVPAHNAAPFIGSTLESILRQSHESLEVIVIDDGSTDDTGEIARGYAAKDPRVKVLRQDKLGVAAARNRGIELSSGRFIAPVDADDIWHPTAIRKMLERFEQSESNPGVVYAWSLDIDESNCLIGDVHVATCIGDVHPVLVFHNFIGNASSTMIEASRLEQCGGYRTEFRIGCEDLDLYLRLAEICDYDVVPEFLVAYRRYSGSMSGDTMKLNRSHTQVIETLRREHPSLPAVLFRLSKINFYVYLARRSIDANSEHNTFYWVREALRTDALLTLLRVDFLYPIFRRFWFLGSRGRKSPVRRPKRQAVDEQYDAASFSPAPPGHLIRSLKTAFVSVVFVLVRWLKPS